MTPISVVIITYNEEHNIERCILSVKPVADDIVVVDSFSTDKTEEICKRLEVRFVQHAFEGHIQQKNWAIGQARYPHIFSLDADEALDEKLQRSILGVKQNFVYDGYFVKRLNNYCGKWIRHSGWYPDKKLRLWNSEKGEWGGENPHDKFEMEKGCKTSLLQGDLLHYSYNSIEDHINQIQKFTTITAKARFEKGKKISVFMVVVRIFSLFFKRYVLKRGFLDGYYGFVVCTLHAYTTFIKDIKLRELYKKRTDDK